MPFTATAINASIFSIQIKKLIIILFWMNFLIVQDRDWNSYIVYWVSYIMSPDNQEKCAACGMTFNTQEELKEHMLELHRE